MEAKLKKLIDSVYKVADLRNLDENNPIVVKIDTENASVSTIIVVAYYEPWRGRYPLNVSWIDANPQSENFKQIFKRISKHPFPETPHFQHEWSLVSLYRDVFVPPQYYDDSDLSESQDFTARVLAHLENFNNPHDVNALQVHSLPIVGGTMLGNLTLYGDPQSLLSAATKQYVDEHDTQISTTLNSINDHAWEIDERLVTLETINIPSLNSITTNHTLSIESLTSDISTFNSRMTSAETNNSLLWNRVDTFDSRIISIENSNNGFNSRINSLNVRVASLENVDVSELGQLAMLVPKVGALESLTVLQSSKIAILESFKDSVDSRFVYTPKSFKFTQTTPSNSWSVVHGLNSNFVFVSVMLEDEIVHADSISIISNNSINITFNVPRSGRALIVVG